MIVELEMVGGPKSYRGRNVAIKGVQFIKGFAKVIGPDSLIPNILKYLEGFGAFPLVEARRRQRVIDGASAEEGDLTGLEHAHARILAEAASLQKQIDEARLKMDAKEQKVLELRAKAEAELQMKVEAEAKAKVEAEQSARARIKAEADVEASKREALKAEIKAEMEAEAKKANGAVQTDEAPAAKADPEPKGDTSGSSNKAVAQRPKSRTNR